MRLFFSHLALLLRHSLEYRKPFFCIFVFFFEKIKLAIITSSLKTYPRSINIVNWVTRSNSDSLDSDFNLF